MKTGINFFSWQQERTLECLYKIGYCCLFITIIVISILLIWHAKLHQQADATTTQIILIKQRLQRQRSYQNRESGTGIFLERQRHNFIHLLTKLHYSLPSNSSLTHLKIKNGKGYIRGITSNIFNLMKFVKSLEYDKTCTVTLGKQLKKTGEAYTFALTISCNNFPTYA